MVASAESRVVALEGPLLALGTRLTVVGTDHPQWVWRATIAKHLADSDVMAKHDVPGPFYEIAAEPSSKPLPNFAVVIIGRPNLKRVGDAITLRLGNPAISVSVRSCASSEGLHLTLWAGTPLKSPRLWHMYYYLGYDVEPTCKLADYSGVQPAAAPGGRPTTRRAAAGAHACCEPHAGRRGDSVQKPDFSGEWTLNVGASALSAVVAPVVQGGFVLIEHREPTIAVRLSITMDGKPRQRT